MKKLLKQFCCNSDVQYFNLMADHFITGCIEKANEQFALLPKQEKKNCLRFFVDSYGFNSNEIDPKVTKHFISRL